MTAIRLQTSLGTLRVSLSDRGVRSLAFAKAAPGRGRGRDATERSRQHAALQRQLERYAAGKRVRWTVPLDWGQGTVFQRKVWRALGAIPYGQTRSYAWVARRIGKPKAVRAVGAACGANPIPVIIPCHRVLASDGSLGGFSGGLAWKRRLLRLEGVQV